jgi:hypothetical protein
MFFPQVAVSKTASTFTVYWPENLGIFGLKGSSTGMSMLPVGCQLDRGFDPQEAI